MSTLNDLRLVTARFRSFLFLLRSEGLSLGTDYGLLNPENQLQVTRGGISAYGRAELKLSEEYRCAGWEIEALFSYSDDPEDDTAARLEIRSPVKNGYQAWLRISWWPKRELWPTHWSMFEQVLPEKSSCLSISEAPHESTLPRLWDMCRLDQKIPGEECFTLKNREAETLILKIAHALGERYPRRHLPEPVPQIPTIW